MKHDLVGVWSRNAETDSTYTFYKDGKYSFETENSNFDKTVYNGTYNVDYKIKGEFIIYYLQFAPTHKDGKALVAVDNDIQNELKVTVKGDTLFLNIAGTDTHTKYQYIDAPKEESK
jgi:hypothetical protein